MITVTKNNVKLSTRLQMIADIIPKGVNLGDIGADHGYLIKYLKENEIIQKGYASDNKEGPYNNLKKNLDGLDIEIDLVSGIRNLPPYVNCLCIAGMGGDTIVSILDEEKSKLVNLDYIVISSHSLIECVRKYLFDNGFTLIAQDSCFDKEPHYYEVNLFKKGKMDYDIIDVNYGRYLIKSKNYSFFKNIQYNIEKINHLLSKPISDSKIIELKEKLDEYSKILELI